jgi:hypothetical protein
MVALAVLAILTVALAAALAVGHAAELPGKLNRDSYLAAQTIYYPGFAIGGALEPASAVLICILAIFAFHDSERFWLRVVALLSVSVMHIVFWTLVQSVDKFWLQDKHLDPAAARREPEGSDWKALRSQWEYSHIARGILGVIGLLALVLSFISR